MKKTLSTALLAFCAVAATSDLPGFALYNAADLKSYQQKLSSKLDANKVGTASLGRWGNQTAGMIHREGNGLVEIHEHTTDVMVIESGEATLAIGGKAENAKTTAPGELRAPSATGAERRPLAPGDIVHIPPGMPHQILVDAGKQITYFALKINGK